MSRWFNALRTTLRSILLRRRAERDLDAEMQFHLEREIDERMRAGARPAAARRAALVEMGAIESSKEECRDVRKGRAGALVASVFQDLRFAVRLFRRQPAPVTIAIGGLAIAIGVVTAVISIVNASIFRPYGMDAPSSVVSVARPGEPARIGLPYAQFVAMEQASAVAAVVASLDERTRFSATPVADDAPKRLIRFVSGGYFAMLGGRPSLGRSLQPGDDTPASPPVVVVSHYFWATHLNGDVSLLGKTVWLNDTPVTLVGVLQPGFTGPASTPASVWAPLAAFDDVHLGTAFTPLAGPQPVEVIARLPPGVDARAAQANLSAIVDRTQAAVPRRSGSEPVRGVEVHNAASPAGELMEGDTFAILGTVLGIVVLVLSLACANTASLLMASAVTRMREIGVRLAMGATRGRLVRQLITESVLLGLIAGGLGFTFAFWLVPIFGRMVEMPPELSLLPDWRVLTCTIGVSMLCGIGAGLSPARFGARGRLLGALQSQSGGRGGAIMPSRFRRSFVALQAGVSALLLVTAALLLRSAVTITNTRIGFDADQLITVYVSPPRDGFDEPTYFKTARDAVRQLPSVQGASLSLHGPWGHSNWRERFSHNGRSYRLNINHSDAGFFAIAGLPILRGRAFTAAEVQSEAPVALISESVARAFFADSDPIGRSLSDVAESSDARSKPAIVIGVVGDALLTYFDTQDYGTIYRPLAERRDYPPYLVVRTVTPAATTRAVEEVLRRIDPRVRATTQNVQESIDRFLAGKRRVAALVAPAALLALVLAGLGVYGVTTFVVGQRTEEVSVRLAIGASSTDVMRLLMKDSLRPVTVGVGVGLGLALVVSQVFRQELTGISPHDPLSIGGAVSVLLICGLLAVVVPARRVSRANPAALLRRA